MWAADTGDIIVAAIAAFAAIVTAALTFAGVVMTVRSQRQPKVVEKVQTLDEERGDE